MLQSLINKAKDWRMKRNTLVIVADIKAGKILASYKGKSASGSFEDNTLPNIFKGVRFEKSTTNSLIATSLNQTSMQRKKVVTGVAKEVLEKGDTVAVNVVKKEEFDNRDETINVNYTF